MSKEIKFKVLYKEQFYKHVDKALGYYKYSVKFDVSYKSFINNGANKSISRRLNYLEFNGIPVVYFKVLENLYIPKTIEESKAIELYNDLSNSPKFTIDMSNWKVKYINDDCKYTKNQFFGVRRTVVSGWAIERGLEIKDGTYMIYNSDFPEIESEVSVKYLSENSFNNDRPEKDKDGYAINTLISCGKSLRFCFPEAIDFTISSEYVRYKYALIGLILNETETTNN